MRHTTRLLIGSALAIATAGWLASPLPAQRGNNIQIVVERSDGKAWREIDPRLVLNRDDRVRFRVKSGAEGYLYVTYLRTSGKYDALFQGQSAAQQNKVEAGKEYILPQTDGSFRIADPPGQDVAYFLLSPVALVSPPKPAGNTPAENKPSAPSTLVPRCSESLLRARGDCLDASAGPKPASDPATLPSDLSRLPDLKSRSLTLGPEQNQTAPVISSTESVSGPSVFEVRISHK
jgi:hypothetical protein